MKIIDRDQAMQRGLKKYFNGEPCKQCGVIAERYVQSFQCLSCRQLARDRAAATKASLKAGQIISKEEAKRRGFNMYFTGVPCSKGHLANRYTVGSKCVECGKFRVREAKVKVTPDGRKRMRDDQAFMNDPPKPTIKGARIVQGWRNRIEYVEDN